MKTTLTSLLVVAVLVAACGTGETAGTTGPMQPDDVILTVHEEGGFAPVEMLLGRHPRLVLQAGGRIYMPGAVPAIYPGPMLTPIFVGTVDQETMDEIMRLVREAGLPEIDRMEDVSANDQVADATTTVITYFDGTDEHVLSVYALGFASEGNSRLEVALDLVETLDRAAADVPDAEEYRPTRVEIRTGDRLSLPDPEFRNTRPWPLDVAPVDMPAGEYGWSCVVVEGPPATDLLAIFADANQATVWDHQGTEYPLIARGLMPGEPGCA